MKRLSVTAVLIVLALSLSACGDDGGNETSAAATADEGQSLSGSAQGAVDEYRAFAVENAEEHLAGFQDFAAALEAGDIDEAKSIYPEARMPWERIEPVAGLFGDLDPALDAREGDVPKDTWGGWHYFEKKLWVDESTDSLDAYIDETEADAEKLVEVAETIEMTPADVAGGAVELLDEVSASKITGEEERYSHTDLWDFQANVEGSEAAFDAVRPLIGNEELASEVEERFGGLQTKLNDYREGDGFVLYDEVSRPQRQELSRLIDATAEPLSQVAPELKTE